MFALCIYLILSDHMLDVVQFSVNITPFCFLVCFSDLFKKYGKQKYNIKLTQKQKILNMSGF